MSEPVFGSRGPGTALEFVRLALDDGADVLDVMLMGTGPFPSVVWRVPRVYIAELLAPDSAAVVQLDALTGGMSIHYPPGGRPGPAVTAAADRVD